MSVCSATQNVLEVEIKNVLDFHILKHNNTLLLHPVDNSMVYMLYMISDIGSVKFSHNCNSVIV